MAKYVYGYSVANLRGIKCFLETNKVRLLTTRTCESHKSALNISKTYC